MATLRGLKADKADLKQQVASNEEIIKTIRRTLSAYITFQESGRGLVCRVRSKDRKAYDTPRFWHGSRFNTYKKSFANNIASERALIQKLDEVVEAGKARIQELENENDEFRSQIRSLTYQINHWND